MFRIFIRIYYTLKKYSRNHFSFSDGIKIQNFIQILIPESRVRF